MVAERGANIPQISLNQLREAPLTTVSSSPASLMERANFAAAAIAIDSDRVRSVGVVQGALSSSSPIRQFRGAGEKIARALATVLTATTLSAASIDMDRITRDVQAEAVRSGVPTTVAQAFDRGTLDRSIVAIVNPIAHEAAGVRTMVDQLDRDQRGLGSQMLAQKVSERMTDLDIQRNEVQGVVDAMKKVNYAAKSLTQEALQKQGLRERTADRASDMEFITDISRTLESRAEVDSLTVGLPELLLTNRTANTNSLREIFKSVEIDTKVAEQLSQEMVRMAEDSPASFSTPQRLKADVSRRFTPAIGEIVSRPETIVMMTTVAGYEAKRVGPETKGGIDINPALLKLLVKRDGNGIVVPVGNVNLKDTDIYGFEPVISKVEQVDNLPAFIGIEETPKILR